MHQNRIPLYMFLTGLILIQHYGIILAIISLILQIFIVASAWKKYPKIKQHNKFIVGIVFFVIALFILGNTLRAVNLLEDVQWIGAGAVLLILSGLLLFGLHTAPIKTNKGDASIP